MSGMSARCHIPTQPRPSPQLRLGARREGSSAFRSGARTGSERQRSPPGERRSDGSAPPARGSGGASGPGQGNAALPDSSHRPNNVLKATHYLLRRCPGPMLEIRTAVSGPIRLFPPASVQDNNESAHPEVTIKPFRVVPEHRSVDRRPSVEPLRVGEPDQSVEIPESGQVLRQDDHGGTCVAP
jgi:hypothetical protein